ncbi:MAG: glycine cleavage system aminomethyltransferase GcvT, partial [Chloroflexota bacterium]
PLFDAHKAAGARMVPFAGWEMPVQYSDGIIAEVKAVRNDVGVFDVSHMGRLIFSGPGAEGFLDRLLSADVAALRQGRAKYHLICNQEGGIIDDAIIYRLGSEEFLHVVNAGNKQAVLDWIGPQLADAEGVEMADVTDHISMIAAQGPRAVALVDELADTDVASSRPFRIREAVVAGTACRLARTGYTGEDGFEIMPPAEHAEDLWNALLERGAKPCGLGARDVLRLEAGLMLHGSDMDVSNNPYEAGLDRFTFIDTPGYVAGEVLRSIRERGTPRVIVGFKMIGRGIPRHGQAIFKDGKEVGVVTSGTHSPTLDANIGMGYVDRGLSEAGTRLEIDVRGRTVEAQVEPLPFYSRS